MHGLWSVETEAGIDDWIDAGGYKKYDYDAAVAGRAHSKVAA